MPDRKPNKNDLFEFLEEVKEIEKLDIDNPSFLSKAALFISQNKWKLLTLVGIGFSLFKRHTLAYKLSEVLRKIDEIKMIDNGKKLLEKELGGEKTDSN